MQTKLEIDDEFKALIPPLAAYELDQLEENIKADGCRDRLIVWGNTLIDGHNRYGICLRLGIEFETIGMEFDSRDEAIEWIITNQFGRRNISDYQRGVLALRLKPIIEARAKAQQIRKPEDSVRPNSDEQNPLRTDETVARLANISRDTIRKIERIEAQSDPEVKLAAAAGEISINLANEFYTLPVEDQRESIASIADNGLPVKDVIREAVHNHRAQGTGENEWYTPEHYIESARSVMGGIDLDPATSAIAQEVVKAAQIFTIDDDGLQQKWSGRVWLNPPYAQPAIHHFMEKITAEVVAGNVEQAIVLTHNYTDTRWFHIAVSKASAICFTRGRIGFLSPEGKKAAPTQGQAFFYFGDNTEAFADEFCQYGFVAQIVTPQIEKVAA